MTKAEPKHSVGRAQITSAQDGLRARIYSLPHGAPPYYAGLGVRIIPLCIVLIWVLSRSPRRCDVGTATVQPLYRAQKQDIVMISPKCLTTSFFG